MENRKTVIKTENLKYVYSDGTMALCGIDLEIEKGEAVALMGANGSGKSTFFLALNGTAVPSEGKVAIDGEYIDYSRKGLLKVRKKVGIVFQDPDDQLFSADVRQELSFGLFNLGYNEEECREKVDRIVEELRLSEVAEKPVHFLSGGEKKRVSIGDILVMEPEIILFDEPSTGLDPYHVKKIDSIIDGLKEKGVTVIMSTHDPARALAWADRTVVFSRGRIAADGKPEEVFMQEDMLKETNLQQPEILKLFLQMKKAGYIEDGVPVPHRNEEFEKLLMNTLENNKK